MFRYHTLTMLFIMLAVAACSTLSEPVPTDVPFFTVTPRPIDPIVLPDQIGDAAIPDGFTGGDPIILSAFGSFVYTVSGDVDAQVERGTTLYTFLPSNDTLPARNQVYIAANDASASQELSFEFIPSIQLGQYPLVAPEDYAPGNVAVSYARLGFDGVSTRIRAYNENIDGTLTLTRIGEAISGNFQFTAEFTDTSPQGEVDIQVIEVTGRFEDVPYQVTLNDPFDIDVPLPTRNFTTDRTQQP